MQNIMFENKIDPIQSVFDVCDIEKEDQGLTLSEVREKRCMDYLASTFGITDDNIIKNFEAVDQDGDGVASKQETSSAFENLRYVGNTLWGERYDGLKNWRNTKLQKFEIL